MSSGPGDGDGDTVFCTNCGAEILAEAEMCPECGEMQGDSPASPDSSQETHDGFTSWAIGFQPGSTVRNILVGLGYFFVYPVGIILLLVGYGQRGEKYKKRAIAIVLALVLLFAIGIVFGDSPESGSSNQQSDPAGDSGAVENSAPSYEVKIIHDGSWSGSVGYTADGGTQQESYSGTGDGSIEFSGEVDQISASIQKDGAGNSELTVQILEDGQVVAEGNTRAEYGVVSVSESFF